MVSLGQRESRSNRPSPPLNNRRVSKPHSTALPPPDSSTHIPPGVDVPFDRPSPLPIDPISIFVHTSPTFPSPLLSPPLRTPQSSAPFLRPTPQTPTFSHLETTTTSRPSLPFTRPPSTIPATSWTTPSTSTSKNLHPPITCFKPSRSFSPRRLRIRLIPAV